MSINVTTDVEPECMSSLYYVYRKSYRLIESREMEARWLNWSVLMLADPFCIVHPRTADLIFVETSEISTVMRAHGTNL